MIRIIRLLGNFNGNKNTTEMGAMSTPLTSLITVKRSK